MNPSEAIFHKFIASLGPRFALATIDGSSDRPPSPTSELGDFSKIIRAIRTKNTDVARRFRYCAGKIASFIPTGYCSLVDGQYCFGITIAFYYCCYESAFRLFQSNLTFADVDPPAAAPASERDEDGFPRPWGFTWQRRLTDHVRLNPEAVNAPLDVSTLPGYEEDFHVPSALRSGCARYVTMMMMRFLWHHEFSHAISGHLPYLHARQNASTLSEHEWFELPADAHVDTALRLWMEYDADTSAVNTILNDTLRGGTHVQAGIPEVDDNIDLRIRLDVMAFVLALLAIAFHHDWTKGPGTHPDPYQRIFVVVMTATQFLLGSHPDPAAIVGRIKDDVGRLVGANSLYQPLTMFFGDVTRMIARQEYNDLCAHVGPEIPNIRAHSFFNEQGQLPV